MTGYTRQSTADILAGQEIDAQPLADEFNALEATFNAVSGHTHDGTTGSGPKIDLTASVSGILPVANGGTGSSSPSTYVTLTGAETLTNKTLTAPVINGGTLGGTFSGAITRTGLTTVSLGISTDARSYLDLTPTDYGVGKPRLSFNKSGIATTWTIALFDTVNTSGTINFSSTGLQWNGVSLTDLTTAQTLTNKTFTSPTINAGALSGTFTGSPTFSGGVILTTPTINGYTEGVVTANTSTTYTISLTSGTVQILTLTGNCTYTFPTAVAGKSFLLVQKQDGTGSRTVIWPAAVKWPGSFSPTLTATISKADLFAFTSDGTNWFGRTIGQNFL